MLRLTIDKLEALGLAILNNVGKTHEIGGHYIASVGYITGKCLEMHEFDFLVLRLRIDRTGYIVWYNGEY